MPAVQQRNAQQFDLYKYLRVIWRRKWLLIVPLAICLPLAFWAATVYPTEYESRAILEMQDNRPLGDRAARQRFGTGYAIVAVKTRTLSWSSIREIVLSRKVDFGREVDPDDRHQLQLVYHEVTRRTRVGSYGGPYIYLSHRSTNAERNASLVNELVKRFVGEDRRQAQDKAKQDLKYYRDKLASARNRLVEIDGQIREFTTANPWLGGSVSEINREYKDAEEEEHGIRRQINGVEEELAEAKKELANEKPEIVITRPAEVSREYREAKKRYDQALAQFNYTNERYTQAHRRWQDAKRRLDEAKGQHDAVDKGVAEALEETRPNPEYGRREERVRRLEKELGKLNARKLDANKRVSELYVRQRKAPELLAEKRALEGQRSVAATTTADYAKGVRSAEKEMQRLLTEAYSSRFKVAEYARVDTRPVKSTQMKIIALGLLLGLLTGAGLVGLIEYLDQTFKSIDDAREFLNLPALGVIPAIYTPRDHRRKLWFRVLAISSAVFVVGVGAAVYLWVPVTREYLNVAWLRFMEWIQYM